MIRQLQFIVTAEEARQRLDYVLASRVGELSRIRIANLLAAGACQVNQETQRAGYHVITGDQVEFRFDDADAPTAMTAENIPLDILYEDDEIIVVNKPSGMLVHPTRNSKSGTLLNALTYHLNEGRLPDGAVVRPGLIHRLDRATSGVMVIAKTQRALSILTAHFQQKRVFKRYVAVVHGRLPDDEGVIIAPLGEDRNRQPPRWVTPEGKYAETRFRVIERLQAATLVELEPVTGRTNQLRIHLAYIGHPIIGDELYGESGVRSQESGVESATAHSNSLLRETKDSLPSLNDPTPDSRLPTPDPVRLCLHAARLEFHQPTGGEWRQFQSPLPAGISHLWRRLQEAEET